MSLVTKYQPDGERCANCKHINFDCGYLPFRSMPVKREIQESVALIKVVNCVEFESKDEN